ncbi:MAG TPA: nitrile hydratase accessory protein [Candidatus Dormibacteraeota bacterium]|jgi:nitrile hydratase accessory protein|nr:nitrile hydratase accessory protein [Candidatus Dormibacteraeota bacterium]
MAPIRPEIANMEGAAALPRKNGELVFEAPWQGRAFGLAVGLHQRGGYDWEDFRQRLIAQIQASRCEPGGPGYYEHWLAALERLVLERGLVDRAEFERRVQEYRSGLRDEVF